MSNCCSSENNAASSATKTTAKPLCPQCGRAGRSVSTLTLKHQVKPQFLTVVNGGGFYFCATPDCPVVYLVPNGPVLTTGDVRRPVTQKDLEHAPVCYCFGFTPAMIRDELAATGKSTVVERIAAEMKSDFCSCEICNPQGSCCLGNMKAAVKSASAISRATV
jgi:hypothetical protein